MKDYHFIFEHDGNELGINERTNDLYWNKKKIVTEQKLTLSWWVNAAIISGGFSTAFLFIIECLKFI